jgi:phosphoserine phosphatase
MFYYRELGKNIFWRKSAQYASKYARSGQLLMPPLACIIPLHFLWLAYMRLVIQGSSVHPLDLQHLAMLCSGGNFVRISDRAHYLKLENDTVGIPARAEISAYCISHALDWAFVPDEQTLGRFGLVVMDMDSTFISIECIDEIADMCNLKPQVSAITESAMRGEIEFAESLRQRVRLLAGLHQSALQRVIDERLKLNPGAQQLVDTCRQYGIKTMLVSGGFDFFAGRLQAMTGLDYVRANSLEIVDEKLTGRVLGDIVDTQAKADFLNQQRDMLGLKRSQVIAIGDGANDLKMMAVAGASIAYHAKPVVQAQAAFALNHSGLDGVINLFTTINA